MAILRLSNVTESCLKGTIVFEVLLESLYVGLEVEVKAVNEALNSAVVQ